MVLHDVQSFEYVYRLNMLCIYIYIHLVYTQILLKNKTITIYLLSQKLMYKLSKTETKM